jgi:hypothetical protein
VEAEAAADDGEVVEEVAGGGVFGFGAGGLGDTAEVEELVLGEGEGEEVGGIRSGAFEEGEEVF